MRNFFRAGSPSPSIWPFSRSQSTTARAAADLAAFLLGELRWGSPKVRVGHLARVVVHVKPCCEVWT